jgi:predicted transcriptional regulator
MSVARSLAELTAADLMSPDVVVIPERMSLRCAAHLLLKAQISGAPVVDDDGRCTGVLSTTDFARYVERQESREGASENADLFSSEWQVENLELVPTEDVRKFMTRDPVAIRADLGINELARMMLNAHIHRLIVVDDCGRPIGVVSTTDILAAVANMEPGEQ